MIKLIELITPKGTLDFTENIGATNFGEYNRTIQLFKEIYEKDKENGLYFAFALLYDSQYDRNDIKNMMEILHPDNKKNPKRLSDIAKSINKSRN